MNDVEEAAFLLRLGEYNKTLPWPSPEAEAEFNAEFEFLEEAYVQQKRKQITPEQLARQRRRMAIIKAMRQKRQNS